MRKFLILIPLLAISLVGCATTQDALTTKLVDDLTTAPAATTTPATTPVQSPLGDVLDKIANNPLLTAVGRDADDTIAWVNAAGLDDLAKFQALACPTSIKLVTTSIQTEVSQAKVLLAEIDGHLQGLQNGQSPELILALTKLRYGPKGTPGSDPQAMLADLKTKLWGQISAIADNCRQVFPAKQTGALMEQAAGVMK